MRVDTLRERFAGYLHEQGLDKALIIDACLTVGQDTTLKYERIDKYRYTLLKSGELTGLIKACEKIGISLWFGIDRICIGYEHRENMRLSAYDNHSVPAGSAAAVNLEDRKLYDEQHGAVSTPVPPPINSVFIGQERCPYCGIGLPSFEGAGMVQYTCSCGKTIQLKAHTMQEFKVSFTG